MNSKWMMLLPGLVSTLGLISCTQNEDAASSPSPQVNLVQENWELPEPTLRTGRAGTELQLSVRNERPGTVGFGSALVFPEGARNRLAGIPIQASSSCQLDGKTIASKTTYVDTLTLPLSDLLPIREMPRWNPKEFANLVCDFKYHAANANNSNHDFELNDVHFNDIEVFETISLKASNGVTLDDVSELLAENSGAYAIGDAAVHEGPDARLSLQCDHLRSSTKSGRIGDMHRILDTLIEDRGSEISLGNTKGEGGDPRVLHPHQNCRLFLTNEDANGRGLIRMSKAFVLNFPIQPAIVNGGWRSDDYSMDTANNSVFFQISVTNPNYVPIAYGISNVDGDNSFLQMLPIVFVDNLGLVAGNLRTSGVRTTIQSTNPVERNADSYLFRINPGESVVVTLRFAGDIRCGAMRTDPRLNQNFAGFAFSLKRPIALKQFVWRDQGVNPWAGGVADRTQWSNPTTISGVVPDGWLPHPNWVQRIRDNTRWPIFTDPKNVKDHDVCGDSPVDPYGPPG